VSLPRLLSLPLTLLIATSLACPASLAAQNPPASSSSSSSSDSDAPTTSNAPIARIAQPEAGGSAITLESSEPLFYLAASLNACGYDDGLAESVPVRQKIRDEINDELAGSAPARDARDALCTFVRQHQLSDPVRSLAQYVSLALFLTPPPLLTPSVDIAELPPDSTAVIDVLPLVRTFAQAVRLNALWVEHRADYDAYLAQVHDPLTRMVLGTNIYLHLPVSSYDGRRFLVLLEPMLAPSETNARYNGADSVVVVSPQREPAGADPKTPPVPMDLIRHTYLHFTVEPLVYARAKAMDRLLPLLRPVQNAPLEFTYKSDIVALLSECLIKAVEAQTMDVGIPKPARPSGRERADQERYIALTAAYDRQAETVRRRTVDRDMRQGWVLTDYFYNQLGSMAREGTSLRDNIGPMIYGMDVDRERHHDEQIAFLPEGSSSDVIRRTPRKLAGLDVAEMKLMKGDADGAQEMAEAALKADPANAQAHYLLGRISLMEGEPDDALQHLTETIHLSHDPRTTAWAHIYLGRMYDIARDTEDPSGHPQRAKAVAEYRAALSNRDSLPDTKAAAEKGLKEPFSLPKRQTGSTDVQPDDAPLDPSGKSEKDAYRPPPPQN
jgi:tetratricopeptide (TPR) repeat protein